VLFLLEKVKKSIEKYCLLSGKERVIVGFSGGIDSTCLLHLLCQLKEYQLEIWAVYVNYSLRPDENLREGELLRLAGERWGIRTREFTVNVPERLKQKPQSVQLLAREERYRIFKAFGGEIEADRAALAHHRGDQAETILYRLIRGTGPDGLAGMPVMRDGFFIRPFLEVSRQEIREYAERHRLNWAEDSSNQKLIYRRNQIRHQLIPAIEKNYNPHFQDALLRLGKLAGEQRDFMETLVAGSMREWLVPEAGRVGLRIRPFLEIHPYLQYYVLKQVLTLVNSNYHLELVSIERLRHKIIRENVAFKTTQILKRITVYREDDAIFFGEQPAGENINLSPCRLAAPGETLIPELDLKITIKPGTVPPDWNQIDKDEVYINKEGLSLPLMIRFWLPGDFFWPLGAQGSQKLHDFFINRKVPRRLRKRIPLVTTADNQIVWIVGYRLDDRVKVKPNQSEIWRISVEPRGD
jgi:tRNA(Ile)-lysidine synthase